MPPLTAPSCLSTPPLKESPTRCSIGSRQPCALLALDGALTLQVPKSRDAIGLFLPATEPDLSAPERQRIAEAYRGRDWRAVARDDKGRLYATAGAASEAEAVDAALKACSKDSGGCQIYAIGNFRVRP